VSTIEPVIVLEARLIPVRAEMVPELLILPVKVETPLRPMPMPAAPPEIVPALLMPPVKSGR
jgi:hypothetical protein